MEDAAATGEGFKPLVLKRRIKTDWALLDHVQAAPTATAAATTDMIKVFVKTWKQCGKPPVSVCLCCVGRLSVKLVSLLGFTN